MCRGVAALTLEVTTPWPLFLERVKMLVRQKGQKGQIVVWMFTIVFGEEHSLSGCGEVALVTLVMVSMG